LSTTTKVLVVIIALVGVLAIITGVIYYVEPVRHLPSFFPGHTNHGNVHRHKRGAAGILFGVLLLVVSGVIAYVGRRSVRDVTDY
jgi:amino acid permease